MGMKLGHSHGRRNTGKAKVFENTAQIRILGTKTDKVIGDRRRLHNEKLNDLYTSPNIIQAIKSRRMRWEGHVAHIRKMRGAYRLLLVKPE
jgi:hypothetical protein